jgi:hypothetical protein
MIKFLQPVVKPFGSCITCKSHVSEDFTVLARKAQQLQPWDMMTLGGIIGGTTLRGAPPEVYAALRAGSLVHVGKACVFGHGWVEVSSERS